MIRALSAIAAIVLAASAAYAATDAVQLEREYAQRLMATPNTAAAQVDLARWCLANDMADRARRHFAGAILLDADNRDARAALGFVKRNGTWVQASAPLAEPPGPTTVELPTVLSADAIERAKALRQQVLDISRQLLIPTDPDKWAEGRARLLAIRDPLAADPIAKIIGTGTVEYKCLATEALGQIPGDAAMQPIVHMILSDDTPALQEAAIRALKLRNDPRATRTLTLVVARSQKPTLQRAARALGELDAWEAVPTLINNTKAIEARTFTIREIVPEQPHSFIGNMTSYVAGVEPVVAPGVVALKPIIGTIGSGNGLGSSGGGPTEVTVEKQIPVWVPQPVVLEALRKITGQDFGYDVTAWRNWFAKAEMERRATQR